MICHNCGADLVVQLENERQRKEELQYLNKCEDFRDSLALEFAKILLQEIHIMDDEDFKNVMQSVGINSYHFADEMIAAKIGKDDNED